jgi:hypothetical protein
VGRRSGYLTKAVVCSRSSGHVLFDANEELHRSSLMLLISSLDVYGYVPSVSP